jgi:osmoprotectant transport system substrate-binding protein
VVRDAVLEQHPEIADLLAVVSERLTDDLMQDLNGRVDIEGEDPSDVAYEWLKSEDLVT